MRGSIQHRPPLKLVRLGGPGSRPEGQPQPEGAAPQGAASHRAGESPGLSLTAVHQPHGTGNAPLELHSECIPNWPYHIQPTCMR